jgi:hypothetical protein
VSDEITSLQATAVFMPIIFLGIAAFLLNLLLARLVSSQRDQIAVLKAFGYSNLDVGCITSSWWCWWCMLGAMRWGSASGCGLAQR